MAESQDLTLLEQFIAASKTKGASDESLAALLMRRGWPAVDVYRALGNHWASVTGLAVPERPGSGESARDAFLYLLSFSTLGTWACALGSLLFQLINYGIPDAVSTNRVYDLRSTITWQMASMAVALPIYLLVMRTIFREAAAQPERLVSGVRKWLTYIALWITAITMVCDLITFLNYFLKGELTERFVWKAITVLAIAGAIFVYYLSSLRWNRDTDVRLERSRNLAFGGGAVAAVAITFCIGLSVAGSPSRQRELAADQKRVQDLRQIAWAVHNWRATHGAIPATLPLLQGQPGLPRLNDPVTSKPYKSDVSYELCGQFTSGGELTTYAPVSPFWEHGKGRTCFAFDASQTVPW
jgi:hypothetical protein